ncbi:MAG: glycosyltransferase family 4 protein [Chloroflexi bacterium]|nr:glycosyltransferase family 4 protein [Chloroflexota bacterium]
MKIALVSPYDFAYPGGVTVHIANLADQFTRWGHQVKILTPLSTTSTDFPQDVIPFGRPVPIPSGGSTARLSLSVWQRPRIKALLRREAFDIVHIHEPLAPFLPLFVLQLSESVNIGTFHAFHGSGRMYKFTKPLLRRWFRKLAGRIVVSQAALSFIGSHFPGEYQIIPNGIDVGHFSADVPPISDLQDGKINILFVGRLEKRKGLKYLLAAFSSLKWEWPNLRLLVVGPGNLDEDSYAVLSQRNVQDVVFLGSVSRAELPRYYRTADIFCAPATGKESFGIVLLEAMAAGKPIVASNIDGYSSVVSHGKEGLLVEPRSEESLAKALVTLIANPELRHEMGILSRSKAEGFRWEKVAGMVMEHYTNHLKKAS